jgi:two-component system, NarL family, nitrate/nitrite response regulator NarL
MPISRPADFGDVRTLPWSTPALFDRDHRPARVSLIEGSFRCGEVNDDRRGSSLVRTTFPGAARMKVAIGDPNRLFVHALALAMRAAGHSVVSTDVTLRGLVASAAARRPDACLVDGHLAADAGPAMTELRAAGPAGMRVIVLTRDRSTALPAGIPGVDAAVSRYQPLTEIFAEFAAPGAGPARRPPAATGTHRPTPTGPGWRLKFLTEREWQVLLLLDAGESTARIGRSLGVRPATARAYVQKLLEKLGVHSRLHATAVLAAYRRSRRPEPNEQ